MSKSFIKILFFTLSLLVSSGLHAQVDALFKGKITSLSKGTPISGAKVTLYKNGGVHQSASTSSNGRYSVKGPAKENYKLVYTASGYVTKTIEVSLDKMLEVDMEGKDWDFGLDISLVEDHEDVDFSALSSQSFAKANFDSKIGDIAWDDKHTAKMNKLQSKLIAEVEKAKEEEKNQAAAKEKEYNDLVKAGDMAVASSDFDTGIAKYQAALKIKDDGSLPPKIAAAKAKQAEAQANQKVDADYNAKIAEAKKAFDSKDYAFAKSKYQEAKGIKPSEAEPDKKIAEIDKIIAENLANEQKFNDLLKAGDDAMLQEDFDNAIRQFQDALKLRAGDPDATKRLDEAKAAKDKKENEAKEAAEKKKQFDELVKVGDGKVASEDWTDAKSKYEEALKLFPDDAPVQAKLKNIETKLAEQEAANQAEKAKRQQYEDLIADADAKFNSDDLEAAKAKYVEASALYDKEPHPKSRIAEIDKKLKEKAEQEEADKEKRAKYDGIIADADSKFDSEDLDPALKLYNEALAIFPDESHPKSRIDEINKLKEDKAKAEAAEKEKREKYETLVKEADALFDSKDYVSAKPKYSEASALYDNEEHPKKRLEKIDLLLADQEAAEKAEKEKKAKYDQLISDADNLYNSEDFINAKPKYEEALGLYPEESHPKTRIDDITQKLKDQEAAEAAEKEKRAKYDDLMQKGAAALAAQQFDDAIGHYKEANVVYPEEQAPKDKIDEIEKLKNDKEAAEKAAQEEAEKRKKYDGLIADADGKYSADNLEDAKSTYEEALNLYPDEPHPKSRVEEINKKLAEKLDAAQKEEKYAALIAEGDQLFENKEYEAAKSKYTEAKEIKDGAEVGNKIAEVDKAISEAAGEEQAKKEYEKIIKIADDKYAEGELENAKGLYDRASKSKFADNHPSEMIGKIDGELASRAEKEALYSKAMDLGLSEFNAKNWNSAEAAYKEALGYFDREDPKKKIAEIQKLRAEAENQQQTQEAERIKREKYDGLIAKGDAAFNSKDYSNAKSAFEEAKSLYPNESYPPQKLGEIERLLKEQNKRQRYDELITKADQEFNSEKLDVAKETYKQAYAIIAEDYPKAQIEKIDQLKSEGAKKEQLKKEYDKIIKIADSKFAAEELQEAKDLFERAKKSQFADDHPDLMIGKIDAILAQNKAKEDEYNKALAIADKSFDKKNWDQAISDYTKAVGIFPRKYPKDQIEACKRFKKAQEEADAAKDAEKNKQANYDKLIQQADGEYGSKSYEAALKSYQAAYALIPEDYPSKQINKINAMLKELTRSKEGEKQYQKIIDTADKLFGEKNYTEARGLYERADGLRPGEMYPSQQIRKIDGILAAAKNDEKKERNEQAYNDAIKKADALFGNKDFKKARDVYNEAYSIKPANYPKSQIDKINKMFEDETNKHAEEMYRKIINQADSDFDNEKWDDALNYYKRANTIKPKDPYPLRRIKEIKDIKEGSKEEFYGEKVNDISVFDGASLIRKHKDRKYNRKVDSVDLKIDDHITKSGDLEKGAAETVAERHKKWDDFEYEKEFEYDENKEQRWKNLTIKEDATEDYSVLLDKYGDQNDNTIVVNEKFAKQSEEIRGKYLKAKDGSRLENEEAVIKRDNETGAWQGDKESMNVENGFSNEKFIKKSIETKGQLEKAKDERRLDNETAVIERDDKKDKWQKGEDQEQTERNFVNEKFAKQTEEIKGDLEKAKDENRLDNETAVIERDEKKDKWMKGETDEQQERNFVNEKFAKQTEEIKGDLEKAKDENRLDNETVVIARNNSKDKWQKGATHEQTDRGFANEKAVKDIRESKGEMEKGKEDYRLSNEGKTEKQEEKTANQIKKDSESQVERTEENEDFFKNYEFRNPKKYTIGYRNGLARKFPQGVSTERYVKKDEYGDVYETVVRKVVVEGTQANEYALITNMHGRTYYKNGVAIAEYNFIEETSGPAAD